MGRVMEAQENKKNEHSRNHRLRPDIWILLAFRTMPGKEKYLTVFIAGIAFFFLFHGIQIERILREEQAQPCEIVLRSEEGKIQAETAALAEKIPGVEAASLTWTTEGVLVCEDYLASVSLCGRDASTLEGTWLQGGPYPEETSMPYVVLNEAAVHAFRNEKKEAMEEAEKTDWRNTELRLQKEGESDIVLRVSGILREDSSRQNSEEARVYLSTGQMRQQIASFGGQSENNRLWLRISNTGVRENVLRELASFSLTADSEEERAAEEKQEVWAKQKERRNLYAGSGAAVLLAAVGIMAAQEKNRKRQMLPFSDVLETEGFPDSVLRRLEFARWGILLALSFIMGTVLTAGS